MFFIFHLRQELNDFFVGQRSFISCELSWRLGERLDVDVIEDHLPEYVGSDLFWVNDISIV